MPVFEVFTQAREGKAFEHGGNVVAPDQELALLYAREFYGRRQESARIWVVPRDAIVEIKDPDIAVPVCATVAASAWRERIVVASFHGPALASGKVRAPGIVTSLMIGSVLALEDLIRLAMAYSVDGVHPCWEHRAPYPHRLLDTAAIARLREARLAVTLWHEERESELRALVALGPDAICTNVPALLRRIVDSPATSAGFFSSAAIDR